jgi:hypothetical protein
VRKKLVIIGLIVCLLVAGLLCWLLWPQHHKTYTVIQQDRDISLGIGDTSRFAISPAQVLLNKPLKQGFTINVSIINESADQMLFAISEEQPSILVAGYQDAGSDYSYGLSNSYITVNGNSTGTITFTVRREAREVLTYQEKGFKIAQIPQGYSGMTTIVKGYIFEILLPCKR